MGILEKMTEFLIKKQWVVFLVSLLAGFVGMLFVTDEFISKLPFTSRDVNVVLCYAAISILCYLIISLIIYIVNKCSSRKKDKKDLKYSQFLSQKEVEQKVEQFKTMVDGWNDYDYSVVMLLINNKNQKPYIINGYRCGDTILTNNNMFYSTQSSVPLKPDIKEGTVPVGIQHITVTKYLLTDAFYGACCTIIKETGNLSHFERKTIDLHQEDYYYE